MSSRSHVIAVVVTHNRCTILTQCLQAILEQTHPVDQIIVVDNASTDGTENLFSKGSVFCSSQITYKQLEENVGGAGGFKEGLRLARETGCDFYWIMDDDVIAHQDALEQMLNAHSYLLQKSITPSFIASHVTGKFGEVMNVPNISPHLSDNGYPDYLEHLPQGLVRICTATFVSLLISSEAVSKVGLPISDYFLWGDDIEYTRRLTSFAGPAFICGNSTVIHMRASAQAISTANEIDIERVHNRRRAIRNDLINTSYYLGNTKVLRRMAHRALECIRICTGPYELKRTKLRVITGGVSDFLLHHYDLEDLENLDKRSMRRF